MIIEAGVHEGFYLVWLILEIASAGVFLHAGIKFPYFVFFAKDNGLRPGEAPKHMLAAMAFLSFICIFLGIYPQPLYDILPYPVDFNAYTFEHTLNQLQLLMFSALAFFLLLPLLKRTETISLDTDWFYRKGSRAFVLVVDRVFNGINSWAERVLGWQLTGLLARFASDPGASIQKYWVRLTAEYSGTRQSEELMEEIDRRSRTATYPIGILVLFAVSLLALMSILFILF